jgi:hypothetical protein
VDFAPDLAASDGRSFIDSLEFAIAKQLSLRNKSIKTESRLPLASSIEIRVNLNKLHVAPVPKWKSQLNLPDLRLANRNRVLLNKVSVLNDDDSTYGLVEFVDGRQMKIVPEQDTKAKYQITSPIKSLLEGSAKIYSRDSEKEFLFEDDCGIVKLFDAAGDEVLSVLKDNFNLRVWVGGRCIWADELKYQVDSLKQICELLPADRDSLSRDLKDEIAELETS